MMIGRNTGTRLPVLTDFQLQPWPSHSSPQYLRFWPTRLQREPPTCNSRSCFTSRKIPTITSLNTRQAASDGGDLNVGLGLQLLPARIQNTCGTFSGGPT